MMNPFTFSLLILFIFIIQSSRPHPYLFLQGVLETVAEKEKWKVEDIRVSKLEVGKVKYGVLQGYDIRVKFGKIDLAFKFWDEVSLWKKFKGEGEGDFESLANKVSSNVFLDSFKLEGPFELHVADDDELALMLTLNNSHTGLKRILVAEKLLRRILHEKLLRRILAEGVDQNPVSGVFKIKLKASYVFRFQMELQRDIRSNDTHWYTMAEWRTRPTVERVWFEAMARIEMRKLKPLMVKRVKPIIGVDSWAWSTLMSNISFTKFPSDLVTHEPLTLDVKW